MVFLNQKELFDRIYKTGPVDEHTIAFLYAMSANVARDELDRLVRQGKLVFENGKYGLSDETRKDMNDPQAIEKQDGEQEEVQGIKETQGNEKTPVNANIQTKHKGFEELSTKKINKKRDRKIHKRNANNDKRNDGFFERLVVKFAHVLQYFAFLITSLADLGLAMFFYWSLGYDNASKAILATWGIVQTGSKIWGWSYNKKVIAVWCSCLSVIASVSIFLAVIELQANNTELSNKTINVTKQIDDRIAMLEADRKGLVERRNSLPQDYTSSVKSLNMDISKLDAQLTELLNKKELSITNVKKEEIPEIKLSAWSIFRQLTSIQWNDSARVFAFVFILALSILLEMVIFATTPRNGGLK